MVIAIGGKLSNKKQARLKFPYLQNYVFLFVFSIIYEYLSKIEY